ncbi:MAG: 4-(cytidine 5'-diphospho)-2-C-methyl-D-erythritol kinase [Acidimicrobiia bacterium]
MKQPAVGFGVTGAGPSRRGYPRLIVARAKLTLSLRVLGRRPDGFHDLEALVTSVADPHDVVELAPRPEGVTVAVSGPAAAGVPAGPANLAHRAATASGAAVAVTLHKTIPAGAGLGGGSADAAAVLGGLGSADLQAKAAELGSDVPFCLTGGLAWMRGRGEMLEPLEPLDGPALVIAVPPFALSTADVYATWDRLGGPRSERRCPPPPALRALLPEGLVNDLEPAALAAEPRLGPFRRSLEALTGHQAGMAGSGPACFVFASDEEQARDMAVAAAALGARTFATRPAARGVEG